MNDMCGIDMKLCRTFSAPYYIDLNITKHGGLRTPPKLFRAFST